MYCDDDVMMIMMVMEVVRVVGIMIMIVTIKTIILTMYDNQNKAHYVFVTLILANRSL